MIQEQNPRRKRILQMLEKGPMSCNDICSVIAKQESIERNSNLERYLSGGVSSILHQMVHNYKELKYANAKSIRGGHLYVLKSYQESEINTYMVAVYSDGELSMRKVRCKGEPDGELVRKEFGFKKSEWRDMFVQMDWQKI